MQAPYAHALAVDGMPLPEGGEAEDEEGEMEMEDEPANFMAAVERGMTKRS